jgi:hypothetical protein
MIGGLSFLIMIFTAFWISDSFFGRIASSDPPSPNYSWIWSSKCLTVKLFFCISSSFFFWPNKFAGLFLSYMSKDFFFCNLIFLSLY